MDESLIVALAGAMVAFSVIAIIWYVICIIGNWKVFTKAGEAGWKSIIPIYNSYISYKISWNTKMFFIMLICAVVSIVCSGIGGILGMVSGLLNLAVTVLSIIQCHKLSTAFGHGIGFTLGLIFLNPIFTIILGFGSSEYEGPQ